MKVDIRDGKAFAAIDPHAFATYLRRTGWQEHAEPGAKWSTFTYGDFEITLPLTTELRDFVTRIAEAVRTLETVEGRDQLQIFSDLSAASSRTEHLGILNQRVRVVTAALDTMVDTRSDLSTQVHKVKVPRRKVPRFKVPATSRIRDFPDEFAKLLKGSGFPIDCIEAARAEIVKVIDQCRQPAYPFLTVRDQRNEFTALVHLAAELRDRWRGISLEYRSDLRTPVPEQMDDFITEVEQKIHRLIYEPTETSVTADLVRAYGNDADPPIGEVASRWSEIERAPRKHGHRGEQPDVQRRQLFLNGMLATWLRFHPESAGPRPIARGSGEDAYHGPLLDFVLSVIEFERIVIPGREGAHRSRNLGKDLIKMLKSAKLVRAPKNSLP